MIDLDSYGEEGVDCKGRKWERIEIGKSVDISNNKYGRLQPLFRVKDDDKTKHSRWLCLCDCGNLNIESLGSLQTGNSKSCGCWHGKKEKIKPPKKKLYDDLTGQRFGNLVVIEKDNDYAKDRRLKSKGRAYWRCLLDDGRIITYSGTELRQSGNKIYGTVKPVYEKLINSNQNKKEKLHNQKPEKSIKNKNTLNKEKTNSNLTGQKFGSLTVIKVSEEKTNTPNNKYHRIYWECVCDCGNTSIVSGTALRTGTVKSCGCANVIDLIGRRFGKLIVVKRTNKRRNRSVIWECECDCGNVVEVCSLDLLGDERHCTRSCGCVDSKGEYKVTQLLLKSGIVFESEKTFDTCRLPESNRLLRFDFYIDNSFLLEYDGEQHFKYGNGWNTKEAYDSLKERDQFKNKWCKENNIPIKRIPYTDLNDFTLDDILSDKYLITEV